MKDLDKSAVDKNAVEKKIVVGYMPWCLSIAALDSIHFPIFTLYRRIIGNNSLPKSQTAKCESLTSLICVWVYGILCRSEGCIESPDLLSVRNEHLTVEVNMPEHKLIFP